MWDSGDFPSDEVLWRDLPLKRKFLEWMVLIVVVLIFFPIIIPVYLHDWWVWREVDTEGGYW